MYFNVNRYCTHLVAFLVSFIHPTLSGHQNQINTFALVSITIIQSSVNSGHGIGNFCVCEDEHFVYFNVNRYCTHLVAFLVSTVHPTLSGHQNQINTFALVSITIIQSSVNSGHGIGNFCVCEDEHFVYFNVNRYCTHLVAFLVSTVHPTLYFLGTKIRSVPLLLCLQL